jgi:hypothetical protein
MATANELFAAAVAASKEAEAAAAAPPPPPVAAPAGQSIQWAPDFSSFIDLNKHPGARWVPAQPANSFDGQLGTPAGWQVDGRPVADAFGNGGDTSSDEGQFAAGTFTSPPIDVLKQYGLWNLQDPNSPTWNYLSAIGGGDARNNPTAMFSALGQLYHGITGGGSRHHGGFQQTHDDLIAAGFPPEYAAAMQESLRAHAEKASASDDDLWNPINIGKDLLSFAGEVLALPPIQAMTAAIGGPIISSALGGGLVGAAGAGAALGGGSAALTGGDVLQGALLGGIVGGAGNLLFGGSTPSGLPDPEAVAWGSGLEGSTDLEAMWAAVNGGGTIDPYQSFVGPQTGTVLEPGLQPSGATTFPVGTSGAPTLTAIAEGAGAFMPVPNASTGATFPPLGAPEESLVGPPTGTELPSGLQSSGATVNPVGTTGTPQVTGVATGAGPFIDAAGNVLSGGAAGSASGGASGPGGASTVGGAATAGTALSRILNGTATTADWLSVLGPVGSTALGIYGADQQADALRDVAEREDARHREMMAMGAPYRGRLESLYSDPTSYLKSSEVTVPVQQGTDALARALSVQGNPAGSGTALHEIQNYATNQLYGRLGQEKDRLAGYGGLTAYNQAAASGPNLSPTMAGINARGNVLNAAGYGLGQITNPPSTLEQLYRSLV